MVVGLGPWSRKEIEGPRVGHGCRRTRGHGQTVRAQRAARIGRHARVDRYQYASIIGRKDQPCFGSKHEHPAENVNETRMRMLSMILPLIACEWAVRKLHYRNYTGSRGS